MKKKLKKEFKNLNLKGGFLSIDYDYSRELKSYKVLEVFPRILSSPIPKKVDTDKYSKKVHVYEDPNSTSVNDHWIKRKDILISIQKEGFKNSLNLENLDDPDTLPKFLGKIPRYTWLKVNFKREVSKKKYIKKSQWHLVQNFDEYCSSMQSAFKDFLFPNIKKQKRLTVFPIDKDKVIHFCVNKWIESLYEGNPNFNMDKAKIIREWIKKWKKKSSTIDSEQYLWNMKNLKRFDHNFNYLSNPEQQLWNAENTRKIEKLLNKYLKNID
jgi:hypothetical protein